MIAPPPCWGSRTRRAWSSGIVAYLLALPVGAVVVGFSLYLFASASGRLPVQLVGIVALVSSVVGSGVIPIRLPESGWRIPRSWARFGHTTYAALFGGVLGLGVLTAIPSIGFYTLLVWGLSRADWQTVLLIFGVFGVARALPLVFSAIGAKRRGKYPDEELDKIEKLAERVAFPIEVVLLATVGTLILMQGNPLGLA